MGDSNEQRGGWSDLLSIAGNIRQQFLPFVIKPKENGGYTKLAGSSKELSQSPAQYFSFKSPCAGEAEYKAGYCMLNVCPSIFTSSLFSKLIEQDISFQTLYGHYRGLISTFYGGLNSQMILNCMPSVQVREYLPDMKIDQLMLMGSAISDIFEAVTGGSLETATKKFKDTMAGAKGVAENITAFFAGLGGGMQSGAFRTGYNLADLLQWFFAGTKYKPTWVVKNGPAKSYDQLMRDQEEYKKSFEVNGIYKKDNTCSMVDFPFMMYYKIMSYVTTNVYELPCKIESAYDIAGSSGWGSSAAGLKGNGMLDKLLDKIGGGIVDKMFGNIRINYMGSWNAEKGHTGMKYPTLNVNFSLFNDTIESAVNNFLFVNTIAPNNMWIQMGLLQHSSSVYDVKIDGHARMYMCTCDVKVKYKGMLRDPSPNFINLLFNKHANSALIDVKAFKQKAIDDRLIRIPDVYEIELTFQSMLPANFNNYLYHYAHNTKMDIQFSSKNAWYPGLFGDFRKVLSDHMNLLRDPDNRKKMDEEAKAFVDSMESQYPQLTKSKSDGAAKSESTKNETAKK